VVLFVVAKVQGEGRSKTVTGQKTQKYNVAKSRAQSQVAFAMPPLLGGLSDGS
jgi:hypothetical protein